MGQKIGIAILIILSCCLAADLDEDELPPTKSLTSALLYTAAFPGLGHFYIEDYTKAVPMSIASAALWVNILRTDPGSSQTYHDLLYNQKQRYQQLYLVFWFWALIDTTAETNSYNRKILNEEDLTVNMAFPI